MGLDRAWWLRLFSQRTQIQYPAPTWQLIIVYNSSSRGSNTFSLGSCTHLRHINLHNHTYTLIKVKDFVFKAKHIKNLYLGLERCSVVKSACCFLVGPKRDFIGAYSGSRQVSMALRAYIVSTSSRQTGSPTGF